jgi:hypothetical protein
MTAPGSGGNSAQPVTDSISGLVILCSGLVVLVWQFCLGEPDARMNKPDGHSGLVSGLFFLFWQLEWTRRNTCLLC